MLERYEPGYLERRYSPEEKKRIPKESYYQKKVKEGLLSEYPDGFVRKISQGAYSQGGIPDLLFIYKGHYFGFEVKRPIVGKLSPLQERTMWQIREAGGTAAVVSYPEQAIDIIQDWESGGIR